MKKIIFIGLLIYLAMTMTAIADVSKTNIRNDTVQPAGDLSRLLRNMVDDINSELDVVKERGTGYVFYVDSEVGSDNYDGTKPEWALATLDAAIGKCTANRGDTIYVIQNHGETKSATGALWTADIAGVTIKGLGEGWDRPTFTLSHTGAKIDVTADGVRIENIIIDATGVDSVNTPVNLSGVGSGFVNCYFRMADTLGQADLGITVGIADGDANDAYIVGCDFISPDAGAASAITFAKDMENFIIANCRIYGDFSTAGIDIPVAGNAQENLLVYNTTVISKNADEPALEANGTANTGAIVACFFASDAEATILDAGGLSVSDDTKLVVLGNGEGAALPANMTLVDLIGDFTGPDDGTAYDDNIFACLKKLSTYVADGDGDFATGTALASNKSIADALGTNGTTPVDSAVSVLGAIGVNDADNAMDTSTVVANANGSVFERLEAIAMSQLQGYQNPGYLAVTAGPFDTTGTWSTAASHEIATVTGLVKMVIVPVCTVSVASVGDNGTIALGDETTTDSIIAASTLGSGVMVANELWTDATLTRTILTQTQVNGTTIFVSEKDIGYTVATNALASGTIVFHIWWVPLNATGAVTAGAGGTL